MIEHKYQDFESSTVWTCPSCHFQHNYQWSGPCGGCGHMPPINDMGQWSAWTQEPGAPRYTAPEDVPVPNNRDIDPEADPVNQPNHYTHSTVEVIDAIEAWGLGFCLGNVVKYVARHEHKGTPRRDLEKARWYLDRALAAMDGAAQ